MNQHHVYGITWDGLFQFLSFHNIPFSLQAIGDEIIKVQQENGSFHFFFVFFYSKFHENSNEIPSVNYFKFVQNKKLLLKFQLQLNTLYKLKHFKMT